MRKALLYLFLLGTIFPAVNLHGQDNAKFHQYSFYSGGFNPAVVGKHQGFQFFLANRQEFGNFPGTPRTLLLGGQYRLKESPVGIGLVLSNDIVGEERRLTAGLQLGYHIIDEEDQHLSVGISLGYWSLNADYSQLKTGVPETGLGGSLIFQQGVLDANMGLHYLFKAEKSNFYFDLATQNLPAAFVSYSNRIDPYGLQIPAQLVSTIRLQIKFGDKFSLEPGLLQRLQFSASPNASVSPFAIIKAGNTFLQARGIFGLGETGDFWVGAGSSLGGGSMFSFGLDLKMIGLHFYGAGGPNQYLGLSHEEGIVYSPGPKVPPPPACLSPLLREIKQKLQDLPNKPSGASSLTPGYLSGDLVVPFVYADYDWERFRLTNLPQQAQMVDFIAELSQEIMACDEVKAPPRFRLIASLQDPESSLDDPTEGTYEGDPLSFQYQLINDVMQKSGSLRTVRVDPGSLNQEQIQMLKLYEMQKSLQSQLSANTKVELFIAIGQASQADPQQINMQILLDPPSLP